MDSLRNFRQHIQGTAADETEAGLLIPRERGGGFIAGRHQDGINKILGTLKGWSIQYQKGVRKDFYTKEWWNGPSRDEKKAQRLTLGEEEILAYLQWMKFDVENVPDGLFDGMDFVVNYLNVAKVGTTINKHTKTIVTADFIPHITFSNLIEEYGFTIVKTGKRMSFDKSTNEFIPTKPTLMQEMMDNSAKRKLWGDADAEREQ